MELEKIDNSSDKQWLINRLDTLKKRFTESLFEVLKHPWKTTLSWLRFLRRKKLAILLHTARFLISIGVGWAAYYALFPSKVYQTKRTDRLFEWWKEDELIKKQWMIEYSINDVETTFIIDMLAGMECHDDWQAYIAGKWYNIADMDTFPDDFANRALYIALRETHKMAFSPKFRIEPRHGDFKHFSNGKIAYTDHRTHTLYSYSLLDKSINRNDTVSLVKYLNSPSHQNDRETLQDMLFYHFMSELSHTYALGVYKHEYIDRFLDDALPGVEIVQDSFPYKIVQKTDTKDSVVQYAEYDDSTLRFITRHVQRERTYRDTIFKENLTRLWNNVYRNTNKYNKSYREWFEDRIHEWPSEHNLEVYFLNTYEKHLNKKSKREMYDYARLLLGALWYMHTRDEKRGKKIMLLLAKQGYAPAIKYTQKWTDPPAKFILSHAVWRKRTLVASWEIQICDTQWNIIHCFESYDEKRVMNSENR